VSDGERSDVKQIQRGGVDDYRTLCLAPTAEVIEVFEAVEKWAA
jgi:NTP pyrophosphatase (non-canonical NTP hydrolase)